MLSRLPGFLEDRTGAGALAHALWQERIPASSGWPQVFGAATFSILVQAFTGLLLMLNFAPTPRDAHASLTYITTELSGGALIRDLHHWGASVLVAVVLLHMIQVFVHGAYKPPREMTWIAGVALLLITLAFGVTGYLLPWDNRAYWGTRVVTGMLSQAPLAGPAMRRLLGGSEIGAATVARRSLETGRRGNSIRTGRRCETA